MGLRSLVVLTRETPNSPIVNNSACEFFQFNGENENYLFLLCVTRYRLMSGYLSRIWLIYHSTSLVGGIKNTSRETGCSFGFIVQHPIYSGVVEPKLLGQVWCISWRISRIFSFIIQLICMHERNLKEVLVPLFYQYTLSFYSK